MPAVVSDASPVVYLTQLGRFELLRQLFDMIFIPPAVWKEVGERGAGRPEGEALAAALQQGWVEVREPSVQIRDDPHLMELGDGEREAISLAYEHRLFLVIDDADGRVVAARLGVHVVGTLGILFEAKQKGLIARVRPEIDRLLHETNFRVKQAVWRHVLHLAGED